MFRQTFSNGDHSVVETINGDLHMVPEDERKAHEMSPHCQCRPWKDDGIWVHNEIYSRH
jgi:hypothetical protein